MGDDTKVGPSTRDKCAEGFRQGLWSLEASKGGMKVGRIKDPLYKDSYFRITPPTFIPPLEAPVV